MNANPSIFDPFASTANGASTSPFSFANDEPVSNPFAAAPLHAQSPFAAMPDEVKERHVPEPGKPAKIPAPRPKTMESPFQLAADPQSGFGFEPPSPFTAVATPATGSLAAVSLPVVQNPFSQAMPATSPVPFPATAPALVSSPWSTSPAAIPTAAHGASLHDAPGMHQEHSESTYNYRQLELRAIFGVDREMTVEEILQRTRALPGIRHLARIPSQDALALENLRRALQAAGFALGAMRIFSGSAAIDFVREGGATLAVQTDGGFAPGVRETLMIVARELDKISSV